MDWIANNWQYIFRLGLAIFAFLLGTLLLTNRKYAVGYAGWLYNFGLLDPKLRESPAPARKAAWLLYFAGVLALAWLGWYWHYFHTLPVAKDVQSPYQQKQVAPGGFNSPYSNPLQRQRNPMQRPPTVTQPTPMTQPTTPQPPAKEEPPLQDTPPLRTR
jgi:hypothetical protein